jgi:hypothetical protein
MSDFERFVIIGVVLYAYANQQQIFGDPMQVDE